MFDRRLGFTVQLGYCADEAVVTACSCAVSAGHSDLGSSKKERPMRHSF